MASRGGCHVQAVGGNVGLLTTDRYIRNVFRLIPRSVFSATEAQTSKGQAIPGRKGLKKKQRQARLGRGNGQLPGEVSLSAKLQQKLSGLRAARKADDEGAIEKRLSNKRRREEKARSRASSDKKRAKIGTKKDAEREGYTAQGCNVDSVNRGTDRKNGGAVAETIGAGASEVAASLQLPLVSGFADDDLDAEAQKRRKATKRGKKRSKLEELKYQLEKAEEDRVKVQNFPKDPRLDTGEELLDSEIEKAMMRVQGVHVKDKVSKLRKTIRKEKRKKEKSREEWAKRTETAKTDKEARQQKREERLKERRENKGKQKGGKSGKKSKALGKGKMASKKTV